MAAGILKLTRQAVHANRINNEFQAHAQWHQNDSVEIKGGIGNVRTNLDCDIAARRREHFDRMSLAFRGTWIASRQQLAASRADSWTWPRR